MASTTRKRHRMRCRKAKCYARFTLPRAPELYVRAVRCPVCRGTAVRSVEQERRKEMAQRVTHSCAAYPFPHERGTLRMCTFHPARLRGERPTEEEFAAHEKLLGQPRSAWQFGGDTPTDLERYAAMPEAPF